MQNKNNIAVTKPKTPVAIALDKMPFPATTLIKKERLGNIVSVIETTYRAFLVSSAM